MKILFVLNNYFATGNGLSASARRTVKALSDAGQEVRVLSSSNPDSAGLQPDYVLKHFHFPLFQPIIDAQGYGFASTDKKVVENAVRWADVVHMEEPFVLQIKAQRIARRLGKPVTGTYHLHPENIFFSLLLDGWKLPNVLLLKAWRDFCFNKWSYVQCPTRNVMERLQKHKFTSRLRLISNGVTADACIRLDHENHPYILACIGRFSGEKDQMTLLEAMLHCRHAREIQLVFAGRGPKEQKIRRKAEHLCKEGILAFAPAFEFLDRDGLRQLGARADLCIHCATVEVEGLSIMEAMQQGAVPIIATGPITGADQFALDERSLFPQRDARELARKIDWWLDHPEERKNMGRHYVEHMKSYEIDRSAQALIAMFEEAVAGRINSGEPVHPNKGYCR